MLVHTETGSAYLFDGDKVYRSPSSNEGAVELRRDHDWLRFSFVKGPVVGEPMLLMLEPLGEGGATVRVTSRVTEIVT